MNRSRQQLTTIMAVAAALVLNVPALAGAAGGTAKGETSDQPNQQGIGLGNSGGTSSNVIMGGPDIVVGTISKIQGDQYAIQGDRGQEISLRVTKDTNMVCSGGGSKFTTGQQSAKEHQEIPPTQFMEQQAGKVAARLQKKR